MLRQSRSKSSSTLTLDCRQKASASSLAEAVSSRSARMHGAHREKLRADVDHPAKEALLVFELPLPAAGHPPGAGLPDPGRCLLRPCRFQARGMIDVTEARSAELLPLRVRLRGAGTIDEETDRRNPSTKLADPLIPMRNLS